METAATHANSSFNVQCLGKGSKKKNGKIVPFWQTPLAPPPVCPFFREKKLTSIFFENEPLVRETNFTLGPIQKPLYLLLLYQYLHLPIIGRNLISAGHWDQYIPFP